MSIYQRLLGHPLVYDYVRPFFVGGIDWAPLYRNLDARADDTVLDIGCGTGVAQEYLPRIRSYYGFDTDAGAIERARGKVRGADVHYECREVTAEDIAQLQPTLIVLGGLLHHLSDEACRSLFAMCLRAPSLRRIVTSDVVYLHGEPLSNLLAFLDRGKHVRRQHEYLALARDAGFDVLRDEVVRSHPVSGKALYFNMTLVPPARA